MENGFNGWTNWETWLCKLWMDEQGLTNWYHDYLNESENAEMTVESLAKMIEEEYWNDYEENVKTGFFSDIVSQALRQVDWNDIAESIIESK